MSSTIGEDGLLKDARTWADLSGATPDGICLDDEGAIWGASPETGEAIAVQADVSQEDQVMAMFQRVIGTWGSLDILVNNAGIQLDAPFVEMTLKQWETVMAVNLTGQFLCAREAVKEFLRRGVVPELSCSAGKIIWSSRPVSFDKMTS